MNRLLIKKDKAVNRSIIFLTLSIVCFLILPTYAYSQEKKTFSEIKNELLGNQVYIYGNKYNSPFLPGQESLINWETVQKYGDEKSGYNYTSVNRMPTPAPYSLKGSKGIVEAVSIKDTSLSKRKQTSAFGEKITDDDAINPYLNIVVRLDDGTLVSCTGFYSTMMGDTLKLTSKVDSERGDVEKNINSIVGKAIYPIARAKLYPPKTDLDTMIDPLRRGTDAIDNYDLLTPLKISRAKYLESENAILLEVNYDNGKTAITIINKPRFSVDRKLDPKNYWDNLILKGGFLEKILSGSSFTTKIPDYLTKKEIEAIKKRSIFKGMSTGALALSWGYEDKSNNWGSGGYQYIYGDKQFVYIKNGKIVDWQSLK